MTSAGTSSREIVQVVSSSGYAGIERHALGLCRELLALGCTVRLVCPISAERMRAEAADVGLATYCPQRGRRHVAALAEALISPPALVHVHDGRSAVAVAAASMLTRTHVFRTQHFVSPASTERTGWRRSASLAAHRTINRRLDGYIAVSGIAAELALRRGEVDRGRLRVISPGVALASSAQADAARRRRATHVGEYAVAFVGRLEKEKRVDVLVHAFSLLRARVPTVRLVVAGAGSEQQRLKKLAEDLGVADAVTWTGWVSEPDSVLAGADIYVNPWPREGFGMAMAEAMSYELPVVAPDAGASPELVENGVTGFLVRPEDPISLASAVLRLVEDRELGLWMGRNARQRALERYGIERTARTTLDLYEQRLERSLT